MWLQVTALVGLAAAALLQLRRLQQLIDRLDIAEEEARFASEERRAERAGRIKAERELRQLQLRLAQLQSASMASVGSNAAAPAAEPDGGEGAAEQAQQQQQQHGADGGQGAPPADAAPVDMLRLAFPLRPVGLLRSCFSRRNGTPRQPQLVPAARARLTLRPELNADFFEGLAQYSHAWVLYVFHENTDLQRLWQADPGSGLRAKVRVPRLDGGRMGVFATRSPHRPCPIGLSVARVIAVEGRTLVLGGTDIVDGSPVLDVKPYVPFTDAVAGAAAPPWVAVEADEEPLRVGRLVVPPPAEAALRQCWWQLGPRSLYHGFEQYRELVEQVLSRDIRSVTQRIKVPQRAQQGGPAALSAQGQGEGYWKVVLNGIEIGYDVEPASSDVVLRSARLLPA